jgi:hypothetical protein
VASPGHSALDILSRALAARGLPRAGRRKPRVSPVADPDDVKSIRCVHGFDLVLAMAVATVLGQPAV